MAQPSPQPDHSVRRVVLPSGKTIEVVYLAEPPPDADHATADDLDGLHVCPACRSKLVQACAWDDAAEGRRRIELRCPDCGWRGAGAFIQILVARLEDELERGTAALVADLRRLAHANMADEVDGFVAALHGGHVLPMDF